jgi:hypothetical protein
MLAAHTSGIVREPPCGVFSNYIQCPESTTMTLLSKINLFFPPGMIYMKLIILNISDNIASDNQEKKNFLCGTNKEKLVFEKLDCNLQYNAY